MLGYDSGRVRQPVPFGKYLLLDRISVGGMAEVFKAKSYGVEGFEKIIAIKRGLVSDQRVLVLDRLDRDVRGEALLGVRDHEAGRRLRRDQLGELAPVHAPETSVEAAPARDAVDVDRDLATRQLEKL